MLLHSSGPGTGTFLTVDASIKKVEGVRMRKTLAVFALFFSIVVTACAAETMPPEEMPDSEPDGQTQPNNSDPGQTSAEQAAARALSANLGIATDRIQFVSTEAVEWPDTCLGVPEEGLACAPATIPGFRVILETGDRQVEYRTDEDGMQVRPATLLMRWRREGGFAGFCDYLTVYLSGEVHRYSCKGGEVSQERLIDLLPQEEIEKLEGWVQQYGEVSIDASDPKGVADGMVMMLEFRGLGTQEQTLAPADEAAMLALAELLNRSAPLK